MTEMKVKVENVYLWNTNSDYLLLIKWLIYSCLVKVSDPGMGLSAEFHSEWNQLQTSGVWWESYGGLHGIF